MKNQLRINNLLRLFALIALLISPTIVYLLVDEKRGLLQEVGYIIFVISIWISPSFLFYRNMKLYVYLLLPFFLLAPLAIFYLYLYEAKISVAVLAVIFESNFNEALEFMSGLTLVIILAIMAYLLAGLFVTARIQKRYPLKTMLIVSALSMSIAFSLSFVRPKNYPPYDVFKERISRTYPFYIIAALFDLFDQMRMIDIHKKLVDDFHFNAYKKDRLSYREVYVLILGESARYDHWGINGYNRNTSPQLSKRVGLVSYSNVITGGTYTRISVPIILTRATASDFDRHYSERSFIAAFREAGFRTYWIATPKILAHSDTHISMHANDADSLISLKKSMSKEGRIKYNYDENLIPILKDIVEGCQDNIFVVLHTMGSHYKYDLRYPDEFDVFKPSSKNVNVRLNDYSRKSMLVNSYDNSILYTDYVIDSVISVLNKYDTVSYVMYISDHGEDLFDDNRNSFGHFDTQLSRYKVHIPLFIWMSERYSSIYSEKNENILKNRKKEVGADNIFYSILDMSNIGYKEEATTKSFASSNFKSSERRILTVRGLIINYESL